LSEIEIVNFTNVHASKGVLKIIKAETLFIIVGYIPLHCSDLKSLYESHRGPAYLMQFPCNHCFPFNLSTCS